jgi:hypothetical protein
VKQNLRERQREYGGRFGAGKEIGNVTGGAVVGNERCDAVVGVSRFRREAGGVGRSVHQVCGNESKALIYRQSCTALQRCVTFYFTNFPVHLSHFYLRKGFEVCGILEDVYVAKKRNMHGKPYGFVKFSNVRDVTKLEKALNAVSFGQFRVSASVARFDRAARELPRPANCSDNKEAVNTAVVTPGGGERLETTSRKGVSAAPAAGLVVGVRVGKVMVPLGGRQENVEREAARKKEIERNNNKVDTESAHDKGHRVYLGKYRATPDDVKWARTGVVATVSNSGAK